MLGSSAAKDVFKTYYSVESRQYVYGEWNANLFANPYVWGIGDGSSQTISDQSGDSISFSLTSQSFTNNQAIRFSFDATASSPVTARVTVSGYNGSTLIDSKTSEITLYSVSNKYVVDFYTYSNNKFSSITSINVSIITDESGYSPDYSNIKAYKISRFDAINREYLPVESVFKRRLAGEAFVDGYSSQLSNNVNAVPVNIAYNNFYVEQKNGKRVCRNFIPSRNSAFKYSILDINYDTTVFAKYEYEFKTNKLVLKVNSTNELPASVSIQIFDGSAWVSQTISGTSKFEDNGVLVLYYNGTSWSKTKWATVPKLSYGTMTSNPIPISGIKVSFSFNDSQTTSDYRKQSDELHLVEISPRFEVDLSDYVESISISKELSNDSLPTPIGISNSNTATVQFSDIPDEIGGVDIFPFSNDSNQDSPLRGIIDKLVKFKIFMSAKDSSNSEYIINAATMYTTEWKSTDGMESTAQCHDISKDLMSQSAPILLDKSVTPQEAVSKILDSIGCTDYDYGLLKATEDDAFIKYFWTVRDKSVMDIIQEVLLPYQISMFIDEYGIIRFTSLKQILNRYSSGSVDFKLTDTNYDGYVSNILEYQEQIETRPSEISIGYKTIAPRDTVVHPDGSTAAAYSEVWNPQSEMLGYIKLSKTISATDTSLSYRFDIENSLIQSFSGYLIINQEIVQFDGQKWNIGGVEYIVKSQEELEYLKNKAIYNQNNLGHVNATPLYILANLKRGMFGTTPVVHNIDENLVSYFNQYKDTTSRNAASNILSKYDYGVRIVGSGEDVRNIAFMTSSTNASHKVYSASFSLNSVPDLNKSVKFGIIFDATTSGRNGRVVELLIKRRKVVNTKIVRSVISSYRLAAGVAEDVQKKVLYNQKIVDVKLNNGSIREKLVVTGNLNSQLNLLGENTLTVIVNSNNNKIAVLVNGAVIYWEDDSVEENYINVKSKDNKTGFKIPALKMDQAAVLSGRRFGFFNESSTSVNLHALQTFELDYSASFPTAEVVATVINGNQFNLSNRNEIESILNGRMVADTVKSISFVPNSIAREARFFEFDYEVSPLLFSMISRSAALVRNENIITRVPAESVSNSSFVADSTSARFVLANSYNKPVFINTDTSDTAVGNLTTYINGAPLEPKDIKFISSKDFRASDSVVKLESDWIQNDISARNILGQVNSALGMKKNYMDVSIFGNPLIQLGDLVTFRYEQRSIPDIKYIVVGVDLGYNSGIDTKLRLRRIGNGRN